MDDKFREKVKRAIEDGTYKQELEKMNFDRFQSIEIQKGIQSHVDVLKYASPEFDAAGNFTGCGIGVLLSFRGISTDP